MKDALTSVGIQARLKTRRIGRNLEVYETIDSTNTRAVALAQAGAPDGTVVLADEQTQGRGRLGRRWFAPPGSALLLSLILRPSLMPLQAQRATMLCSLAAVRAIARVTGLDAQVKWPNDVMYRGRKVGGVLTELGLHGEQLKYVVVGMGLNVNLDMGALPELMAPATSLSAETGRSVSRTELLAYLLEELESRYERMEQGWSPHEEWRTHLATLGQHIQVGMPGQLVEGTALDVDPDGALLVRLEDGSVQRVIVGDVTLRGHAL